MPFLYLSPSTQEFNLYSTTGNEELWMNRIADAMEPYLRASGINFTRNDPSTNAATAIRESNAGNYDFHLALHSNAAAGANAGNVRGVDVYYYPASAEELRMANILVEKLKEIYPLPDLVRALPTTSIGEVRRTKAPSVLAELGYHDNVLDARWVEENVDSIARYLSMGVSEYFSLPFLQPEPVRTATVVLSEGSLNLRTAPNVQSGIYRTIPNGVQVEVYAPYEDWYSVGYDGVTGFVRGDFLRF